MNVGAYVSSGLQEEEIARQKHAEEEILQKELQYKVWLVIDDYE
jgi:hypothetical protein